MGPWSPDTGGSARVSCHVSRDSRDSADSGSEASTKRMGGLSLLSAPPQSQYRARSPSPLSGPAHHHLVMEAAEAGAKILSNNNTEATDLLVAARKVAPASIPSQCSTQLAKVLEKQIEVI